MSWSIGYSSFTTPPSSVLEYNRIQNANSMPHESSNMYHHKSCISSPEALVEMETIGEKNNYFTHGPETQSDGVINGNNAVSANIIGPEVKDATISRYSVKSKYRSLNQK